jgi:hypothetical protein
VFGDLSGHRGQDPGGPAEGENRPAHDLAPGDADRVGEREPVGVDPFAQRGVVDQFP